MNKSKAEAKPKRQDQVVELLYQALETEQGGVQVYRTALKCVTREDLRAEWEKYLAQTERHVEVVEATLRKLGLDPDRDTPGRQVVRTVGTALVRSMQLAQGSSSPTAAELAAAEAVVLAETKDHMNWALLTELADGELAGDFAAALSLAVDEVEDEEDEHLYHSQGWARELWKKSIGLDAHLPPPEEVLDVGSELEAAEVRDSEKRATQQRHAKAAD